MKKYFQATSRSGVHIPSEEWDNLILLDACRYDMFNDVNHIRGDLQKRHSKASATHEFLDRNFSNVTLYDTVYVTANPIYLRESISLDMTNIVHDVVDVWREGWNGQHNTVLPETMYEAVIETIETYPNKRIIAHFVQPHHPFIGEYGQQIDDQGMRARDIVLNEYNETKGKKVWEMLEDGEISRELVWKAYVENLELTLPYISSLIDEMDGRTVVTSDHGNQVGEYAWPFPTRLYGHPSDMLTPELTEIPWLVVESERKSVEAEPPVAARDEVSKQVVSDRLSDLGYT